MTQPEPLAPGIDPDAPPGRALPDRWVRFDGDAPQTVIPIGEWAPGDIRLVPDWLAARLLARTDFIEVDPPQVDGDPSSEPVKVPHRRPGAPEPVAEPVAEPGTSPDAA